MGDNKRKIKYQKVVMYNDTDMMLVKDALSRVKKTPNESTQKLLDDLTQRIAEDLDVKVDMRRKNQFLETVLYDYIALTR